MIDMLTISQKMMTASIPSHSGQYRMSLVGAQAHRLICGIGLILPKSSALNETSCKCGISIVSCNTCFLILFPFLVMDYYMLPFFPEYHFLLGLFSLQFGTVAKCQNSLNYKAMWSRQAEQTINTALSMDQAIMLCW